MNNIHKGKIKLDIKSTTLIFVICTFAQRGISVLTTPIFTRLLTPEQFGYYSVFNSYLEIIAVFSTLCLYGNIVTHAIVRSGDNRNRYISSTIGLGTFTTFIVGIIYLLSRDFFNRLLGINSIIFLAILVSAWGRMIFNIWSSIKRIDNDVIPLVSITIFITLAKPILGIVAILVLPNQYGAEARIVSLVFVEFVAYIGMFITFIHKEKKIFDVDAWKHMARVSIPLIPHYLTKSALNQSDKVMIKAMCGADKVGLYGLAHSLAWIMGLINEAFLNVFSPWFAQRIKSEQYEKINSMARGLLIVDSVANIVLIIIAPEVMKLFAPKEYYEAVWIIPPLSLSIFFMLMYSMFASFGYYYEKSSSLSIASIIVGIVNIILNYFFIKIYGYIVAGYTTLICFVLNTVIHYIFMQQVIRKELDNRKIYNVKEFVVIALLTLMIASVATAFYDQLLIRYILFLVLILLLIREKNRIVSLYKELWNEK